jgi:hypothetical protein
MAAEALFGLHVATIAVVMSLVARWYLLPWLRQQSWIDGVTPLLLVHATRVVGVVFVVDGVVDPALPRPIAWTAAIGDVTTAALALASLGCVRRAWRGARWLVAATNVVGAADILIVTVWGMIVHFPAYKLGAAWFIPTTLGPVMMVTHALMVWLLLRPSASPA